MVERLLAIVSDDIIGHTVLCLLYIRTWTGLHQAVFSEQSLCAFVVGYLQSPDFLEGLWKVEGPSVGDDTRAALHRREDNYLFLAQRSACGTPILQIYQLQAGRHPTLDECIRDVGRHGKSSCSSLGWVLVVDPTAVAPPLNEIVILLV